MFESGNPMDVLTRFIIVKACKPVSPKTYLYITYGYEPDPESDKANSGYTYLGVDKW